MKKIKRARKAIQGLAMALALATTVSGCSFKNSNDVVEENTITYESVDESQEVEHNHNHEDELVDTPTDHYMDEEVKEPDQKVEEKEETKKTDEKSDKKDVTSKETEIDVAQESFLVMFEGQELVVPNLSNQYTSGAYTKWSINLALKMAGFDNSFAYRSTLARFYGIKNYKGTSSQNILLLTYLRNPQIYLDMAQVINNDASNTQSNQNIDNQNTDINNENNNQNNENTNGNGNGNGNGNNGGGGHHGGGEDEKHNHTLGSVIMEFSNVNDNTHTVTRYRVCSTCSEKVVQSVSTVGHSYTLENGTKCACGHVKKEVVEHKHTEGTLQTEYTGITEDGHIKITYKLCTDPNCPNPDEQIDYKKVSEGHSYTLENGTKCACGHVKKHVHGDWKTIDEVYVALENGQHRVDLVQQCQVKLADGTVCTETRTVPGNAVDCNYGDNDQCKCGNIKGHDHANWKEIDTVVVASSDGLHHRIDSIQQCQVMIAGKVCTFTRTVQGEEVDCSWTLNDKTKCDVCGNTHTHDMTYTYKDQNNEEGTCSICDKTATRAHSGVVETETTTVVVSDGNGHKFKVTVYCPTCDHALNDKESDYYNHNKVATGRSDIQYNSSEHYYNEHYGCGVAGCGYDMGTEAVDAKPHNKQTSWSPWEAIKGLASGIFNHTRTGTVTCADGCGWSDTKTETEECSPLGSTCKDCGQTTAVHQHQEFQGSEIPNVNEPNVCKRIPVYVCGDSNCPDQKNNEIARYIEIGHTPTLEDIEHPRLDEDGSYYVWRICDTCKMKLEKVPYTMPEEEEENQNDFDFDLAAYALDAEGKENSAEEETAEEIVEAVEEVAVEVAEAADPEYKEDPYVSEEEIDEDEYQEAVEEYEELVEKASEETNDQTNNQENDQNKPKTLTLEQE